MVKKGASLVVSLEVVEYDVEVIFGHFPSVFSLLESGRSDGDIVSLCDEG